MSDSGNILFDIFANALENDQNDWKTRVTGAREIKRQYDALKYVGFNDEQAMYIIEAMISGIFSRIENK